MRHFAQVNSIVSSLQYIAATGGTVTEDGLARILEALASATTGGLAGVINGLAQYAQEQAAAEGVADLPVVGGPDNAALYAALARKLTDAASICPE